MLIRGLEIENLKSIKNIKMECSDLNLLIGINSSGKSDRKSTRLNSSH